MARVPFNFPHVIKYKSLIDCTPEEIQEITQSGKAPKAWKIGDRYPIELNGTVGIYTFNHEIWYAEIIGFNHNADLETSGLPSVTFQFGQAEDGTEIAFIDDEYDDSRAASSGFVMNTSDINSGGWESSYMRNTICSQFLAAMPQEWQDIIKPTIKYTDNVGGGSGNVESNITPTQDKIFLLSEYEISGYSYYTFANTYEKDYQASYNDRYPESTAPTNARTRYKHSATSSTCYWWMRSPRQSDDGRFCTVDDYSQCNTVGAGVPFGFAPAFTIF